MKKKAKKLTPIQKLRKESNETINRLKEKLSEAQQKRVEYYDILESMRVMFSPQGERSYGNDRIGFADIPLRVHALVIYRARTEGSIMPEREQNERLMEVIRWAINPKTAKYQPREITGRDIDMGPGRVVRPYPRNCH